MPKRRASTRKRPLEDAPAAEETSDQRPAIPTVKPMRGAATVAALGRNNVIASLADRVHSLTRRVASSYASLSDEAPLLEEGVMAAGREAVYVCGVLASQSVKDLEAAAEELRVRGAQLEAHAALLEWEAEDREEGIAASTARALLAYSALPAHCFVALLWDGASLWHAVDAAVRVRDGIDPLRCTVSGAGLKTYLAGDADNYVSVVAVDGEGGVVETIEAEDVTVNLSVEGASVTHLAVGEGGVVKVAYQTPVGCAEPVTLHVNVCGAALHGSPWTVLPLLSDSEILACVAPKRRAAFLRELSTVWLPDRTYKLLYRGSQDGMTADSFHSLCDHKGPTLVLVRCDKGFVFGGYAGASWRALGWSGGYVASPASFVLSVFGPHSPGPVKFPVVNVVHALYCGAGWGPTFFGGLHVRSSTQSPTDRFDESANCGINGKTYEDVLKKGAKSLTGERFFKPQEVEVFAVITHT